MSRTTTKIIIARQDGSVLGQYVLGAGEHVIGRELDAAIYIDDPGVSRAHARLIISEDIIEIEDLQSTSGTYVDGVAVRGRIPLEPSQKVHISDLYIDIVREGFRELVAGARLTEGRFTLIRLLGQGGMGAVWLAQDEAMNRQVALKLLPSEMTHDTSGLQDLEREVAKTARFQHANILQIEGLITTEDEPPFILMEYVEGTNLHEVRRKNPDKLMIWSGVRHYMLQLCEALEYAHSQKVAHRDLKPSNLLINPQAELKLADFGIAASIAGTASTLTIGVLEAGTPSYMSPQQVEGRLPQATDDIYSLGATFYDLLTSKPPFYQGDIVHQVLNIPATPIKDRLKELNLQNEVPDYVSAMVMACLHKDPAQRPPTANAVKRWIETEGKADFVAVKQVAWDEAPEPTQAGVMPAVPVVASEVKSDWLPAAQRKKILAYGIVAAVMAILIGTATWWTGRPKEINGVSAAMQAQLKEGLVAYYPFNGNAKDESGNGNDGEVKGPTLTTDRHGKQSTAYKFDGKNSWIAINQVKAPIESFTYSMWVHPDEHLLSPATSTFISRESYKSDNNHLNWFGMDSGGKYLRLHTAQVTPGVTDWIDTPQGSISLKQWSHFICTFDGGFARIYLNGQLIDSGKAPKADPSTPCKLTIGRDFAGGPEFFAGTIDDIRIYNRALSEEEVAALYNLEKPDYSKNLKEGLVAHYPFNGRAKNLINGKEELIPESKIEYSQDGNAAIFNGEKSWLNAPPPAGIMGDSHYSISVMIKPEQPAGGLFMFGDHSQPGASISLILSDGGIRLSGYNENIATGVKVTVGKWQQLCFSWDGLHYSVSKVDNDGYSESKHRPVNSSNLSYDNPDPNLPYGGDNWTGHVIGGGSINMTPNHYKGWLKNYRIYNRALSAGEIKALYDLEKTSGK